MRRLLSTLCLLAALLVPLAVLSVEVRPPFRLKNQELPSRQSRTPASGASAPSGYSPTEVLDFYSWSMDASAGQGSTIAVIVAYHSPTAEDDLGNFSAYYGLPPCRIDNNCLVQVDQYGFVEPKPPQDPVGYSWPAEAALDIQWAHAVAPGARILLVEAHSTSYDDFVQAVRWSRRNADLVSASWLFTEAADQLDYDYIFTSVQPYSFFAPSGDYGPSTYWPSTNPAVIAVGGTQLVRQTDGSLQEQCWELSGGGCSLSEPAPAAQLANAAYTASQVDQLCAGKRSTPDISSLAADVWIYFSGNCASPPDCWFQSGGTSLGCPLLAAQSLVLGVRPTVNSIYKDTSGLIIKDVTVGSSTNQFGDSTPAMPGYDLCSGLGSVEGSSKSTSSSSSSTTAGTGTTTAATTSSSTTIRSSSSSGGGGGSTSDGKAACFAADSTVRVQLPGGDVVRRQLDELRVDDLVEGFDAATMQRRFTPVLYVAHRHDNEPVPLLQLSFLDERRAPASVRATPNHLLLAARTAADQPQLVPARDVKLGDYLFTAAGDAALRPSRVHAIDWTTGKVRNPLTLSDSIVVDGVAASVFVESASVYRLLVSPIKLAAATLPSLLRDGSWFVSLLDTFVSFTDVVEHYLTPSITPIFSS